MKQMIKGIDILLYSGDSTEVVNNVLVGNALTSDALDMTESSGKMQTYTLAIPKGDNHDWTSRIVEFFGQKFRTVGVPLHGIEENIPLCWHKQINVQKLDVSGKCTVYEGKTFTRHKFENVYFYDNRGELTVKDGITQSGALTVQIYADRYRTDDYKPIPGDIVVFGECDFEFNTETQESTSQSMAQFRWFHKSYAVVSEVNGVSYGTIPDIVITAS